jgi:hypothetical protein
LWLTHQGVNIDNSLFELKFNPPQNFAAYRQSELDTARAATFAQLQQIPHLSKRFALKRYLGLTQEEITENERLWLEENSGKLKPVPDAAGEMRSIGISAGGISAEGAAQQQEADPAMADAAAAPVDAAAAETPPAAPAA